MELCHSADNINLHKWRKSCGLPFWVIVNNGFHFWLSVTFQSTVGQQVTDTLPTVSNENRVGQLLAKCQSTVGRQLANSIFWELFFTFTPFCFIFAFFVFFARLKTCQWHKCLWFNSPDCLSFLVCQYPPITNLKYHTKWSEWWVSESFTNRREKPKLLWKQIFNFLWHFSFLFLFYAPRYLWSKGLPNEFQIT